MGLHQIVSLDCIFSKNSTFYRKAPKKRSFKVLEWGVIAWVNINSTMGTMSCMFLEVYSPGLGSNCPTILGRSNS